MERSLASHSLTPGVDALVGIDASGCIVSVNSRTEELFQYSTAEMLGRPAQVLIPVRLRQRLVDRGLRNAADPWSSFRDGGVEFHGRRRDGTEFSAEIVSDVLETQMGKVMFLAVREHMLREVFDDQLEQAKKMEVLGQFAGQIAHDLNDSLNVILAHSEWILHDPRYQQFPGESMKEIVVSASIASSIAHQLRLFGRKESPEPQVLDLNEVISEMRGFIQTLLGERVKTEFLQWDEPAPVRIAPSQIRQVIINLVANARDAMPKGGRFAIEIENVEIDAQAAVTLSHLPEGGYVRLRALDTGRGMSKQSRSNLFKPFFTTKTKGTGFGLAIIYGIIKQSGGGIEVTSAPQQGTTFTLYFPRVPFREGRGQAREGPSKVVNAKGSTIMVVEDRISLRKVICKFLKSRGYKIIEARDGVAALRKLRQCGSSINVLLTDIVMPTIGGFDLAMHLNQVNPNAKVVFITGSTGQLIWRETDMGKMAPILRKPFSLDVLTRTISNVLEEGARPRIASR